MQFLDIHTHQAVKREGVLSIQSLSLTSGPMMIPKNDPIALGLHPWEVTMADFEAQFQLLQSAAQAPNVFLIGECGLDKLRGASLAVQEQILVQQILLAEQLHKPLIIHCVKAFDELIAIKNKLKVKVPMIVHGFNKSVSLGKQLIAHGFYLSFGHAILNEKSHAADLLAMEEIFFLETDDAAIDIEEIYLAAANLKKCSVDELKACIFANWEKIKN